MKFNKSMLISLSVILFLLVALFILTNIRQSKIIDTEVNKLPKCLIIASYNDNFEGQKLKINGIRSIAEDKLQLRQFDMDTKENPNENFCKAQALKAKELADNWQPDIIIAVDDNASKYFVMPYMKDSSTPIVFCGLEWTADEYKYPYSNATGIIEVFPVNALINYIKMIVPQAKTAVCISGDRLSAKKDYLRYKEIYKTFDIDVIHAPVKDYEHFKTEFLKAQKSDIVIFQNYSGIENFNQTEAKDFIYANGSALIVSQLKWMAKFSMLSVTQVVEEQGEYAASTAIKIMEGYPIDQIPVISNRQWDIYMNESFLNKANYTIPEELIHKAKRIQNYQENSANNDWLKKCFYIASYHSGYKWQDEIDAAIFSTLSGKCKLQSFYMDSKRNNSPEDITKKTMEAHKLIQKWQPDIIIATDDNASKYLIQPYYKDSSIPVVFCGINWTAQEYGYPFTNTTGMIETFPIPHLIKVMKIIDPEISKGVSLYPAKLSSIKNAKRAKEIFNSQNIDINNIEIYTMKDFKREYIKAQSADFIYLNNPTTIDNWDHNEATEIINEYSKTLTVTTTDWVMPYSMLGITNSPEEHGEYAAQTALKILEGIQPNMIPIINNRKRNTFINSKLLQIAGITIPGKIINSAVDIAQ